VTPSPKRRKEQSISLQRSAHWLREAALTAGAIAGVLCILATILGVVFDVTPVVFRSGSMSPKIETGALAFNRDVPARDLHVGDVVTVSTPAGVNVTHRIVNVTLRGETATLVLKGDANKVPDDHAYVVTHAGRVFFSVPRAGYVVHWLSGSAGMFLGGIVVGGALLLLFRKGPGNKSTAAGVAAVAGVVALGSGSVVGTQAYWTDTALLTSGSFTGQTAPKPPSPDITNCTTQNGSKPYVITWTWSGANPNGGFRFYYTNVTPAQGSLVSTGLAGTARNFTTPDINGVSGTFNVVSIVNGVESLPATANFAGQGSGKSCTGF
jgi:signal peptidase I